MKLDVQRALASVLTLVLAPISRAADESPAFAFATLL